MRFDILTIFPDIFDSYLQESIMKRAIAAKKIAIHVHDIRAYSKDKHKKVDDVPYGGGAGMVMTPQPLYNCIQAVKKYNSGPVVYLSPKGPTLTQRRAESLVAKLTAPTSPHGLILLCGRYEGIDQRIIELAVDQELSIGKYILTGGELGAMVVIDVLGRLIPGVLGAHESTTEESFSKTLDRKKEYPHYTRPPEFMEKKVPEVLLSGNHAAIKAWRKRHSGK